jgi:hypothetical protein
MSLERPTMSIQESPDLCELLSSARMTDDWHCVPVDRQLRGEGND